MSDFNPYNLGEPTMNSDSSGGKFPMTENEKTPEQDKICDEVFDIVKKYLMDTTRAIYDGGDEDYQERVRAIDGAFNHGLRVMESEMVAKLRSERSERDRLEAENERLRKEIARLKDALKWAYYQFTKIQDCHASCEQPTQQEEHEVHEMFRASQEGIQRLKEFAKILTLPEEK